MAQQTAVDYLIEKIKLKYDLDLYHVKKEIGKANNIFREQIKDAYWNGTMGISKEEALSDAEKFYNEYYNKNQ